MTIRATRSGAVTVCAASLLFGLPGSAAASTGSWSGSAGSSSGSAGSSSGSAGSSAGSGPCGPAVATPFNPGGWRSYEIAAPRYVDGPDSAPGTGSGALKFETNPVAPKIQYFQPTATPLRQTPNLAYTMYVDHGLEPAFQLRLTGANRTDDDPTGFTTLVWQPHRNGTATTRQWTTATALENGLWWSTRPIAGTPGGQSQPVSLATITAANPNARITAYGINLGTSATPEKSYISTVTFGCTTWTFAPGSTGSGSAGSSSGSAGSSSAG
ncbi:hypothetical protein [Nocardia sp. NPDC020380]|uniref:hypothetical protein n=1 Tax=Nocardia sp. NPDC020380 TaxID=3364309 RepID=UPI00379B8DF8